MLDRLHKLQQKVITACKNIGLNELLSEIDKLEAEMSKADFWSDQDRARTVSKKHSKIKAKAGPWLELNSKVEELVELAELEDDGLKKEIQTELNNAEKTYGSLEFALKFSGKFDDYDALVSIHAGTGGTDAMDWAEMLERMYLRYSESKGWEVEIIERSAGDEAGIKRVLIGVSGAYAYGRLKSEHGVHRLVRLSPFNSDNLRQTSFALIEVTPQIDEPDEVEINDSDLKVDVYRSGGKGGQSVNTTDSAVRITHIPTNIVVAIQNERSQLQNKQTAMTILRSKLAQLQAEQHAEKISDLKGPDVQAAWGNQIRNYVLHPYTLVKDTRTKFETSDVESVLGGNLDELVNAYLTNNAS